MLDGQAEPEGQERPLPDYCHRILGVLRKTYFGVMPTKAETFRGDTRGLPNDASVVQVKSCLEIRWEGLGILAGMLQRVLRFAVMEAEEALRREGLMDLTDADFEEFIQLVAGRRWLERKGWLQLFEKAEVDLDCAVTKETNDLALQLSRFDGTCKLLAALWGPEAMASLNRGIVKGIEGFMDAEGAFVGESLRANNYLFLLTFWPEIQAMQGAKPPKSRRDLYRWLKPFADDGLVSIQSYEQLCDICDDIRLTLRGRGAPRKQTIAGGG